jgi:hypothetical protein
MNIDELYMNEWWLCRRKRLEMFGEKNSLSGWESQLGVSGPLTAPVTAWDPG